MRIRLPEKTSYTLRDIESRWSMEAFDIQYFLINKYLKAHAWIPVMSVERIEKELQGAQIVLKKHLQHWEGYISICSHGCRRLYKYGRIHLREFNCDRNEAHFSVPAAANDIVVELADLVILSEECRRFEEAHGINVPVACRLHGQNIISDAPAFDPSFRIIRLDGEEYRFGQLQAAILRLLYESALSGDPWQNGKRLLKRAGSQSFTLSNVFKHNPAWRRFVVSDRRGLYRITETILKAGIPLIEEYPQK